jgi:tetratricopeptide (TPR) repeat protein
MDARQNSDLLNDLTHWRKTIDRLLQTNRADDALRLLQILLGRLPRYLPAYVQMMQALWIQRNWRDGRNWALRLLRADAMHELSWSMLARAAEDEGQPGQAHRYWLLAFEQAPYNRRIRQGIVRTALGGPPPLTLNQSALATLYRHTRRWQDAARLYAELSEENPNRSDFQCGLLEALWQMGHIEAAIPLARSIVSQEPTLMLAWLVSAQIGDEDDRALAQAPLVALDVDGAYATLRYGRRPLHARPYHLPLTESEIALWRSTLQESVEN